MGKGEAKREQGVVYGHANRGAESPKSRLGHGMVMFESLSAEMYHITVQKRANGAAQERSPNHRGHKKMRKKRQSQSVRVKEIVKGEKKMEFCSR